jgi:hypothetical protein
MGNDGGSIAKRRDLARSQKKTKRLGKAAKRTINATICSISAEPLQKPVVACRLGRLFNKEAVLEAMVGKAKKMREFRYIKGLKDLKEVKLTETKPGSQFPFMCPITGQEMDSTHKFLFNWNCGCVVSENALAELPSPNCLLCSAPITEMVRLNQSEDEQATMKRQLCAHQPEEAIDPEENPSKRAKLVDQAVLDHIHQDKLDSDERKAYFRVQVLVCRGKERGGNVLLPIHAVRD